MAQVVRVKVTEQHISEGARGSAAYCPIARALCDLGFRAPLVSNFDVTCIPTHGATEWASFVIPSVASVFVSLFDGGHPVKPIEFDVHVPDHVTRHDGPTRPLVFHPVDVGELMAQPPVVPEDDGPDAGDLAAAALAACANSPLYVPPPATSYATRALEAVR